MYSTASESEIESLTLLDASLIELDRRKTRRRHRLTAALAPSKSKLTRVLSLLVSFKISSTLFVV